VGWDGTGRIVGMADRVRVGWSCAGEVGWRGSFGEFLDSAGEVNVGIRPARGSARHSLRFALLWLLCILQLQQSEYVPIQLPSILALFSS
jgi:hypothetical protein